jgi:hypothetical protein
MVGLSLKEISFSQPMDVQNDKLNKHKSAQQIVNKKDKNFLHNNISMYYLFTLNAWEISRHCKHLQAL